MPDKKFHSLWQDEDGQYYVAPTAEVAEWWKEWGFRRITDRKEIARAAKIARTPNAKRDYSALIIGIALALFGLVIWYYLSK